MLPLLAAQRMQFGKPPLVAGAPRGDAVAQPILFHRDLAAELVLFAFLLFEDRVAPRLERREALIERAGDAAIEPHGRPREAFEQSAVMADQHDTGAHLAPARASSHSMPGRSRWLVGSSSSRISGSGASARASAARRASPPDNEAQFSSPDKPELLEQIKRAMAVRRAGGEPGLDIGQRRGEPGQVRFLRQIADHRARLRETLAGIGLDEPGGDLQQRRFSGAVAPDEADAVTGGDGQPRPGEKRRPPECQADILQ